jgi:hypothetical protein
VIVTAGRVLRALGPPGPDPTLMVVRSWGTVTTLVKPHGFSSAERARLQAWCESRRFDIDWPRTPGPRGATFNRLADDALGDAASAAAAGGEAERRFLRDHPFRVAPVSDARPYPHHFVGRRELRALLTTSRGDWLPFAEWGYLALLATLLQALLLGALLMVIPVAARVPLPARVLRLGLYFTLIGFAYLAAEIAAIQQMVLLLGHPVYAVAAVLAGMLAVSGAGSVCSDRFPPGRAVAATALLAVLLVAYGAGLLRLVHALQGAPALARTAAAVLLVVPPAFLMGMPFAAGLRAFTSAQPERVAWAWAMSGFASVVAAPLAALIALEAGTPILFGAAAAAYAGAAWRLRAATAR